MHLVCAQQLAYTVISFSQPLATFLTASPLLWGLVLLMRQPGSSKRAELPHPASQAV